jgi:hypothetical protein
VPAGHRDGGQWTRVGRYGDPFSSDLIPDNNWNPGAQYAAGGNDNNIQHQNGVEAAQRDYLKRGYSVVRDGPVAVDVPGFATPRFYDFIVQDPVSGYYLGIEVKTTLRDTIRLNPDQAMKDVMVVQSGGVARITGWRIRGVGYTTYCWACDAVDLRSARLHSVLKAAKIPFTHGRKPGETLP